MKVTRFICPVVHEKQERQLQICPAAGFQDHLATRPVTRVNCEHVELQVLGVVGASLKLEPLTHAMQRNLWL